MFMTKNSYSDISFDKKDLLEIQTQFHTLIEGAAKRSWNQPGAQQYLTENADKLPQIVDDLLGFDDPRWFPVAGMYGGFSYTLSENEGKPVLRISSWSRVIDGSEQYHEITVDGVERLNAPRASKK